ncbi:uncharacterized protein LOC119989899 isoform X2 [Tripterygium wilfordii]|uniref:uncharacterized protein LOC119989899 isoform X2 n=1 Tax=Tripterygium wilfordii TaxID=458696 RepID=UPI0018F7FC8E|nr:uncharacterized protein LOC119989899 isoform X2 [Tripterygium wilfordii]
MEKRSRNNCPGVRLIGGRIYDSENGKTCHQCRQKTRDFSAQCKNQKGKKICSINFCHKCLLNRYGEKAADVALLERWSCPKCKDICNCSFCMKARGHKPTGILAHTAKEHGFCSVSEMLKVNGPEIPETQTSSNKETVVVLPIKRGKENSFDGNSGTNVDSPEKFAITDESRSDKTKRRGLKEISNSSVDDNGALKKSRAKKPKICEDVNKKKVKTSEKDGCELKEKKKSEKQILKAASFDVDHNEDRNRGTCKDADFPIDVENDSGRSELKAAIDSAQVSEGPNCRDQILNGYYNGNAGASLNTTLKPCTVLGDASYEDASLIEGIRSDNEEAKQKAAIESCHFKMSAEEFQNEKFDAKIQLPQGSRLTIVEDVLLPHEDVGHALQFLEFCSSFGKVLNLKKGNTGIVIKEIALGQSGRRSYYSIVPWIHIRLLSLILEDRGEKSKSLNSTKGKHPWVQALGKLVSHYPYMSSEFSPDCFDGGIDGYGKLTITRRFKLLNFLCDEALSTKCLRRVIDDQNSKFLLGEKEAKEKVSVAKEKKKGLKQKMHDELAKVIMAKNGASLSISEHEALVSQIKSKAAEAHMEMLEAKGMAQKMGQRSDAVRTEPILSDANGSVLWKLRCYSGEPNVLLQDMGTLDSDAHDEKWFSYDDQKEEIEKCISSLKRKRVLGRGRCLAA